MWAASPQSTSWKHPIQCTTRSTPRIEGIVPSQVNYDFSRIMDGLRSYVREAREKKYVNVIEAYDNVTAIEGGKARFLDGRTVEIYDASGSVKARASAPNILIATGSRPSVPSIDGLRESGFLTSDTVWDLDRLPASFLVIGGGAIGLEIGQALAHLGSEVTVVEAMERLLPQTEPEIGDAVLKRLEEEGMRFYLKARVMSVSKKGERKAVKVLTHRGGTEEIEVDEVLVATGRVPNTDALNLEAAGVKTDRAGYIMTGTDMRTSREGIYAAGDCVSKKMYLETLAAREGVVAVSNMFGDDMRIDYSSTPPWAVFTYPQVAGVGVTEEEYSKMAGACSCRVLPPLSQLTKATIMGEGGGMIKIVIDPNSGRIVGGSMRWHRTPRT